MMAARLYRLLVRLHPQAFGERFGGEMLCIFDEAGAAVRPGLFVDCLSSLARQWLLRSGCWKIAAGAVGAVTQMAAAGAAAWLGARSGANALAADRLRANGAMPLEGALLLVSGILTAMLLGVMVAALVIARRTAAIQRRQRRRMGAHR